MHSRKQAKLAFASAIVFLLIATTAAGLVIARLSTSLHWIAHTYDVQVALGDISSTFTVAGRGRTSFELDADEEALNSFNAAIASIPGKFTRLEQLAADNSDQVDALNRLRDIENQRRVVLQAAVDQRKLGPRNDEDQKETSRQVVALGASAEEVIQEMLGNERRLMVSRRAASSALYLTLLWILVMAVLISLALFYAYYRWLESELRERERAEKIALESRAAARQLSTRLLHLQDEERRKFSRELHDSLGQYLAACKMGLDALATTRGSDELLDSARSNLDQAMAETRTISYLLHPPLLDETGLGIAARWYIEGFAQRSRIQIACDIAEDFPRLPHPAELAIFRVLQECLTNIHRHSKSARAEVSIRSTATEASLQVRDFGHGIAPEVLQQFRDSGTNVGVGLAGMSERVRDQGGQLDIQSDASGVLVSVTIPCTPEPYLPPAPDQLSSSARS
ncbi:MAG TPA: CHASE3 domain-containing protein [Candidatus Dormibacteraeota bacterium]|nr:CHASE3 domain-containing protein [Candidatus Dormibacteraeota bacterium]